MTDVKAHHRPGPPDPVPPATTCTTTTATASTGWHRHDRTWHLLVVCLAATTHRAGVA